MNLAPQIRRVAIPTFRNDTYEADLEATLSAFADALKAVAG